MRKGWSRSYLSKHSTCSLLSFHFLACKAVSRIDGYGWICELKQKGTHLGILGQMAEHSGLPNGIDTCLRLVGWTGLHFGSRLRSLTTNLKDQFQPFTNHYFSLLRLSEIFWYINHMSCVCLYLCFWSDPFTYRMSSPAGVNYGDDLMLHGPKRTRAYASKPIYEKNGNVIHFTYPPKSTVKRRLLMPHFQMMAQ